jgi:hypothetical protein
VKPKHAQQTQIADLTSVQAEAASRAIIRQISALMATPVTRQQLLIMSAILTATLARTGKLAPKEPTLHVHRSHAQPQEVNAP